MSDPLTALMHVVQVMNLLKTLTVKTLRERGETEDEGYLPMSSSFSDRQTEKEFDTQWELETICESTEGPSDDDDEKPRYNYSSEDRWNRITSEMEGSFLQQLDENDHAKNNFRK